MKQINSKQDLKYFLEADKKALKRKTNKPKFASDEIWKFQIALRKSEYFLNCRKDFFGKLQLKWMRYRLKKKAMKLGFSVPLNCFGPGLRIVHRGTIVINGNTKIGANCTLHVCVNIGSKPGETISPILGDNIYIGPGAKLYGDITIGDNTIIGANAVVNKSFPEGNTTLVGAPAHSLSS